MIKALSCLLLLIAPSIAAANNAGQNGNGKGTARTIVRASVEIVEAERISFAKLRDHKNNSRETRKDRQISRAKNISLVEFH